jgi:hypothetical protein
MLPRRTYLSIFGYYIWGWVTCKEKRFILLIPLEVGNSNNLVLPDGIMAGVCSVCVCVCVCVWEREREREREKDHIPKQEARVVRGHIRDVLLDLTLKRSTTSHITILGTKLPTHKHLRDKLKSYPNHCRDSGWNLEPESQILALYVKAVYLLSPILSHTLTSSG